MYLLPVLALVILTKHLATSHVSVISVDVSALGILIPQTC